MSSRFVFLDRDGTLVRDTGYPHRDDEYALLPGAIAGLKRLAAAGYRFAIVTNQSGIGRGLFTEDDFDRFQGRLLADLAAARLTIDATYHCPHLPDAGCDCRKPATGMLERARRELGADLAASWVIGDGERDVALAHRAGCRAVWIRRARPLDAKAEPPQAPNLATAADIILATDR